uniref:BSD domain-containing protein n=1 Tax=Compsopogon caeruleus TaxID=31354 RepID=A0A7S1TG33_9RHOD|mmetsp:Transcript_4677/g.9430  ORF Transcript_4677/g.9430 Transcript_4677/m.9430 type:complete len:437 (+) Transcript_4677:483-1793(+)
MAELGVGERVGEKVKNGPEMDEEKNDARFEEDRTEGEEDGIEEEGEDVGEEDREGEGEAEEVLPSLGEVKAALGELDQEFDDALGKFSESVWNMASDAVQTVVRRSKGKVGSTDVPGVVERASMNAEPEGRNQHEVEDAKYTTSGTATATLLHRGWSIPTQPMSAWTDGLRSITQKIRMESSNLDMALSRRVAAPQNGNPETAPLDPLGGAVGAVGAVDTSPSRGALNVLGGWLGTLGSLVQGREAENMDDEREGAAGRLTRQERRVLDLQVDPHTYCEPVQDVEAFEKWCDTFDSNGREEECEEILNNHNEICDLYARMVPDLLEEDVFWLRYFYRLEVLQREEQRRLALLEASERGTAMEEEIRWSDEAASDIDEQDTKRNENDSENEEEDLHVSRNVSIPAPGKDFATEETHNQTTSQTKNNVEEPISDDDWE